MHRLWRAPFAAASLLGLTLAVLGGSARAQQDRIRTKDGKERTAKVLSEDFDVLTVALDGGTSGLRWSTIASVRYEGADRYYRALDVLDGGDPAGALPQLASLAEEGRLRPPLKHAVLYDLGRTYQKLGKLDEQIRTNEALLETYPKSRYLVQVVASLLAAHRVRGDAPEAAKALEQKLAAVPTTNVEPSARAAFELLRGTLLEEQGKLADADRIYEGASKLEGVDPAVLQTVRLSIARCAQLAGRKGDAEQRYRQLVLQDAPNAVLAGAWNGLGDLVFQPALEKRDVEGLREALFAYLRGVVLYVPDRDGPTDEHERALAGAAKSFKALGELDANPQAKKLSLDRGKQCNEELALRYPRSRYLKDS